MFSDELKKKWPDKSYDTLEAFKANYDQLFYSRIKYRTQEKDERSGLARKGFLFLLSALGRSRAAYEDSIHILNNGRPLSGYLTARAHYETTAAVGHFYRALSSFYMEKTSLDTLNQTVLSLMMGVRTDPNTGGPLLSGTPKAINVMTMIQSTDKELEALGLSDVSFSKAFAERYEFLSEACHPNWAGLTMATIITDPPEAGAFFEKTPKLDQPTCRILANAMVISCMVFFLLFKGCWENLEKEKEQPILIR